MTNTFSTTSTLSMIHRVSAIIVLLIITTFLLSSTYAELTDLNLLRSVKRYIALTLPVLVILMGTTVITGQRMGKSNSSVVRRKLKRMRIIGLNGVVLISIALILYLKVVRNEFDTTFWVLQTVEQVAGISNIWLLTLMARDGMLLSGRIKSRLAKA